MTTHEWHLELDDVPTQYRLAAAALYQSRLGRDENCFWDALNIAVHYSERALAYSWPKDDSREVRATWSGAAKAARKLAIHFAKHTPMLGLARLQAASEKSGLEFKRKPAGLSHPQAFAKFLRALAEQQPDGRKRRLPHIARRIGALQIKSAPISV